MVQIDDYDVLDDYVLKIEQCNRQIQFNNQMIKLLNQRNTAIKDEIASIEEDMKDFKEQQNL